MLEENKKKFDEIDRELFLFLQKGLPVVPKPYEDIAEKLKISQESVLQRIKEFKDKGLMKRIDFRLNFNKMGFLSTLVACQVSKEEISKVKDIIAQCPYVSHNYLRQHQLNMWFTVTAPSEENLEGLLKNLKQQLGVNSLISFPTKKRIKLGFRLHVN